MVVDRISFFVVRYQNFVLFIDETWYSDCLFRFAKVGLLFVFMAWSTCNSRNFRFKFSLLLDKAYQACARSRLVVAKRLALTKTLSASTSSSFLGSLGLQFEFPLPKTAAVLYKVVVSFEIVGIKKLPS